MEVGIHPRRLIVSLTGRRNIQAQIHELTSISFIKFVIKEFNHAGAKSGRNFSKKGRQGNSH